MGEVINLIPPGVRTLPTRCFQQAVERYSRAVRDSETSNGGSRVDVEHRRALLVDEWERVQDHVVDEMTRLSASPAGLRAALESVVARVFAAADARIGEEGGTVSRKHVCEILTRATPDTPVDVQ